MPDLALVIPALAALLIILAWSLVFSRALQAIRPHVPGLFGPLFDALSAADNAIYNALRGWADAATGPFTDATDSVIAALGQLVDNPQAFARSVSDALGRAFNVAIPDAISLAQGYASGLVDDLKAWAQSQLANLEQGLAGAGAQLLALGQALERDFETAVNYALSVGQQAVHYAEGLFNTAEQDLEAVAAQAGAALNAAETDLVNRIDAVAVAAAQDLRASETDLVNRIDASAVAQAQLVAEARNALDSEIKGFSAAADKAIADVIASPPVQAALATLGAGESMLAADVQTLVILSAKAIRDQLGNAEAIRAKYGPQVMAALTKVRS